MRCELLVETLKSSLDLTGADTPFFVSTLLRAVHGPFHGKYSVRHSTLHGNTDSTATELLKKILHINKMPMRRVS